LDLGKCRREKLMKICHFCGEKFNFIDDIHPLTVDIRCKQCINQECTCSNCGAKNSCEYSFDGYNTNGDCIAEK
jgi:hypothetical protein